MGGVEKGGTLRTLSESEERELFKVTHFPKHCPWHAAPPPRFQPSSEAPQRAGFTVLLEPVSPRGGVHSRGP